MTNSVVGLIFATIVCLALGSTVDPTVMQIKGLGYLMGKKIQTVGYRGQAPKVYHSYKNIKFANATRFKVGK